jgi:hypothetical protein
MKISLIIENYLTGLVKKFQKNILIGQLKNGEKRKKRKIEVLNVKR